MRGAPQLMLAATKPVNDAQVSRKTAEPNARQHGAKLELKGRHDYPPVALGDERLSVIERCGLRFLRCCKETRQRRARDAIRAMTRAFESDSTGSGRSTVLKLSTAEDTHA